MTRSLTDHHPFLRSSERLSWRCSATFLFHSGPCFFITIQTPRKMAMTTKAVVSRSMW